MSQVNRSQELTHIPNLGEKSVQMLSSAGIQTAQQLRELGPVIAYLAVKQAGHTPSINLLWAIAAGLKGRHWTDLSDAEKQSLRDEIDRMTR